MDVKNRFTTRSFTVITFFMMLLGAGIGAGVYFGGKQLTLLLTPGAGGSITIPKLGITLVIQSLADVVRALDLVLTDYPAWMFGGMVVLFFFCGVLLWLVLRLSTASLFGTEGLNFVDDAAEAKVDEDLDKKDYAAQRIEQERKRRLFLHFLSVLQRDGRLLDFFSEELDLYDDEQIGAAVRSIQEDCKKSVKRYLAPSPVIDKEEGEAVEVPPGFDPDAIKLTGNVSGEPPFHGILRHRGWKAGKVELPKLADVLDPSIIAPAEVEVE